MKNKLKLCDEIVLEEFKELSIVNDKGESFLVPIVFETDEKAIMAFTMLNETNEDGLVVDRIQLPYMNLYTVGYTPLESGGFTVNYCLHVYTVFVEDINQIVEQILVKFRPTMITSKLGYRLPITLESIANNLDPVEVQALKGFPKPEKHIRIVKYEFNLVLTTSFEQLEPKEA